MTIFKDLKVGDYFVVPNSLVYYQKLTERFNSPESAFIVNAKILLKPKFSSCKLFVDFRTPGRVRGYISPNSEVQKVEYLPKRFQYFALPFTPQ